MEAALPEGWTINMVCCTDTILQDVGAREATQKDVPQTRPAEISNGVSLSDKVTRLDRPFVPEQTALDAFLARDGLVEMLSPNKHGISGAGAQDDVFPWPDELALPLSSWALVAAVVAQIEAEAGSVAVLCDPPVGHNFNRSPVIPRP